VEVTTLNSWGFRRIKNVSFSPKLLTSKGDFHFAMLNQLQSVWKNHDKVKGAIERAQNTTPRKILDVMDGFKSLGFDHIRHTTFESFHQHAETVREHGLTWKFEEFFGALTRLGVLDGVVGRPRSADTEVDREVYDAFFEFWREATAHLIESATFTLEDQKYYAYLDERQKMEEGKFLSGAASYDHVLVDEFQDINPLDLALVRAIAERNRAKITIVGDDDQAIFEWRGATPEYILEPDRFFGTKFMTFTLAVNYRSPANIVELSQRLIAHNQRRVPKATTAWSGDNAQIVVKRTTDLAEALREVHALVRERIERGESPSRVAVIGRKRSQLIPFQVYFASKDISFCAAEDLQVFMSTAFDRLLRLLMIKERAEMRSTRTQVIDDLIDLCNLVKRYPLNKKDKDGLRKHLQQAGASKLIDAVMALGEYKGSLKGANADGSMSASMALAILAFLKAASVSDALGSLSQYFDGLQVDLGKAEDDIFYTDPPFFQLAEFAAGYGDDYGRFVDDIERAKDQLAYVPPFEDETQNTGAVDLWKRPLHLMTALRAKGKEFDSVVLLDVNDGIWPNRNAKTPAQLEAERRVFYVAFTRARSHILMLVSRNVGNRQATVSPYLEGLGLSID
jgi:ATP-dependent DNA helicase UvrD/PcrA